MSLKRVNILLSAFNSVTYLRAQLDSLLAQNHQNLLIIIRDDASTDGTSVILQEYADRYSQNIKVIWGEHVGAIESFLCLLRICEADCIYAAFCDHDDVWLSNKIARGIEILDGLPGDQPSLYCGRRICVDEDLNPVGLTLLPRLVGYENALVENIASGCTMMLNRPAQDLINMHRPHKLKMYDWWCYLVVSAFGHVYYDANPYMYYRQHRGNLKGDTPLWHKQMFERLMRIVKQRRGAYSISDQVAEFLQLYGNFLPAAKHEMAQDMLQARSSLVARFMYAWRTPLKRQTWRDQVLLRLLIIAGVY